MFLYIIYISRASEDKISDLTPFILFSKSRGLLEGTYIGTRTPGRNRRETRKFLSLSVIEKISIYGTYISSFVHCLAIHLR